MTEEELCHLYTAVNVGYTITHAEVQDSAKV